jgi:hypothetical protein
MKAGLKTSPKGHATEAAGSRAHARGRAGAALGPAPFHPRLPLGNQAIQQLFRLGAVRAKLTIGSPDDPLEREADHVADRVMQSAKVPSIQRKCEACAAGAPCPKCEEGERLGRKAISSHAPQVTPAIHSQIASLRGSGRPLPPSARAFFEPRFRKDFADVRVHTDAPSAESARAINARAFTLEQDIVFDEGAYAPGTVEGQRLLAHELTHVAQQRERSSPSLQRQPTPEPIELPPEHPMRLERLEALAEELRADKKTRAGVQEELKALQITPNDRDEASRIDEQRKVVKEDLKNTEEHMIDLLEGRISLLDEAIAALFAVVPGMQTSPESANAVTEIVRLQQQRELDKKELTGIKRGRVHAEIEEIEERLRTADPSAVEERKALEERKAELGKYLSETANNRLPPGANGKASSGQCYVVYQNEVRVGGSLNWRFKNPGSVGPPPSAKGLPSGALGVVGGGTACGGSVGLYIFSDPSDGQALTINWTNEAAAKQRFAGEFLLSYSHEGQKYLDCVSGECRNVSLGTERNGGRGENLKTLRDQHPADFDCIKKAIFFCESGSAAAGTEHTCGDSNAPTEFRRMLGCDEETMSADQP